MLDLYRKLFNLGKDAIKDELGSILEEALGVSTFSGANKILDNTIMQAQEYINKGRELQVRMDMVPSNLNGTHKPPYHSTVFLEVAYEFNNILGTGNLILIFNPEGFGWKPKDPQIIRYVSEKEASAFFGSKSWGNYWRENFLLKRPKHFNQESVNVLTGETYHSPRAQDLTTYLEDVSEVGEDYSDTISSVFQKQINDAIAKQQDISKRVVSGIENSNLTRPFEDEGLRITDMLGQKIEKIPTELIQIATQTPFVKELGKFTSAWKKYSTKLRNAHSLFNSAVFESELNAKAIAISDSLGGGLLSERAFVEAFPKEVVKLTNELGVTAAVAAGRTTDISAVDMFNYTPEWFENGYDMVSLGEDIGLEVKETGEFLTGDAVKEIMKKLAQSQKWMKFKDVFIKGIKKSLKPPTCLIEMLKK